MRMCVIRNKDKSVTCLALSFINNKKYYYDNYDVVCFINKEWTPHYINIIRNYFKNK